MNESLPNIHARMVEYTNAHGTLVQQQRFYEINEVNGDFKWRQIKNADARAIYADAVYRIIPSAEQAATPAVIEVTNDEPAVEAIPEVTETSNNLVVEAAGATAVASLVETDPQANLKQRAGFFDRFKKSERKDVVIGKETKRNLFSRKVLAGVGAACLTLIGYAGVVGGHEDNMREMPSLIGESSEPSQLIGFAGAGGGAAETTATTAAAETTTTTSPEKKALQDALNGEALTKIGLKEGQYTEITDLDAAFPGTLEANHFSMNHGPQAWEGFNRTPNGAKLLSSYILSEDGFTESDADVVTEALKKHGLSDELIEQIADGDYSNVEFKFYTLNGSRILYRDMSYNNNGTLGIEDQRVVSPGDSDAISLMSFKGADGATKVVPFRIDCGGSNAQPFGSVTIETPAAPKAPETPKTPDTPQTPDTTTPRNVATSTTRPRVTTTTRPTSSTTAPPATPPKTAQPPVTGGPNTTVEKPSGPNTTETTRRTTTTRPAGNTTTTQRI